MSIKWKDNGVMPLAATFNMMQSQIKNAFSLGKAATPDLKATIIASAVAAAAPSGLLGGQIPLVPAGLSGAQAQIKNAFSLDKAASPMNDGNLFAVGIAMLCPSVPPAGQTALAQQVKNALSLGKAATPDLVATIITAGIITYYTTGGVV